MNVREKMNVNIQVILILFGNMIQIDVCVCKNIRIRIDFFNDEI